ncbi:hypothetical protein DHEL01_v207529 [Diaporthe helianthi]|uniref:Uncharacterized protein n=1 Tax=Diaporthe helianthi TaxID=158607 RepID=A0A2P5HUY2_DIAHE|nr:hypothetical protein DHEL01_v207529 [Diaporthe helianthi]
MTSTNLRTDEALKFFAANPSYYDGLKCLIHQSVNKGLSIQDIDGLLALAGALSRLSASDAADSDDSDDRDLVHRLAVTSDPKFAYRPDLFTTPPDPTEAAAAATSTRTTTLPGPHWWSYGTLYRVDYRDVKGMANLGEKLEQKGLKLPEIVLSLGRLVVTTDQVTNQDGSSWSASDYGVMVDMHLFNPNVMDMALLFPRIDDWESSDNA